MALKNGWQLINRILITIFALMIAYACCWPWGMSTSSHKYDDQSYSRFGGTLAQPVVMTSSNTDEVITIPAGTAVIYNFDESGNPHILRPWDEEYTPDYGGILPHDYPEATVTSDVFTNPSEVAQNYQEYRETSDSISAARREQVNLSGYKFVPSQLIIGIPAGLAVLALLWFFENKFENSGSFTLLFGIWMAIFTLIYIATWSSYFTLCK